MITLVLYGFLAEKYGKKFEFKNAHNVKQAVSILKANFPEVEKDLLNYRPGFKVVVDSTLIKEEEQLDHPYNHRTVRIVPAVAGSGKGLGIVLGLALMFIPGVNAAVGGFLSSMSGATAAAGLQMATNLGFSLILSGVSALLFAPSKPTIKSVERTENDPSNGFNGPINTTQQGNCVPVLYGKLMVGSQTISAGLYTEQLK